MAIETEIKLRIDDIDLCVEKVGTLNPTLVSPRHFEDNYVLDFPDGRIRAAGCLVRIRMAGKRSLLTYKGVAQPSAHFKSRDEIETEVADGLQLLAIFENLGLSVSFRYQKYRREYAVAAESPGWETHITIDETPVGIFVEVEGTETSIRSVATRMGFAESSFIRDSYYSLYLDHCQERGKAPAHMLFE